VEQENDHPLLKIAQMLYLKILLLVYDRNRKPKALKRKKTIKDNKFENLISTILSEHYPFKWISSK